MKHRLAPKQLSLKELPPEGREFDFTKESGELSASLKDLIGTNAYHLHVKVTPMGNTFDLRGTLKAEMDLQCSLCANDFKQALNIPLHELIVIEKPFGKGDQTSKANHAHEWESGGPDYIVLQNDQFDVADYAHEAIGLAEPIRPLCSPQLPDGCVHAGEKVDRPWLSYGHHEKPDTKIHANPFAVLEKLKLKS